MDDHREGVLRFGQESGIIFACWFPQAFTTRCNQHFAENARRHRLDVRLSTRYPPRKRTGMSFAGQGFVNPRAQARRGQVVLVANLGGTSQEPLLLCGGRFCDVDLGNTVQ
jgi:hypothetical protein